MTLGLTIEKLILIGFLAAMLIGPARLPAYAAGLRRFVDRAKNILRSAEGRVRDELGPEFTDADWRQLDPRRFDPRRIVREALLAEPEAPVVSPPAPVGTPDDPGGGTGAGETPPVGAASGARETPPVGAPPDAGEARGVGATRPVFTEQERRDAAA